MAFYSDWRVRSKFNLLTFPLMIAVTGIAAWAVHVNNNASIQDSLIKRAQGISRQLMADRQYYATVIVPRLIELGGSVGANYQQVHGQFPLPATFVREVSELTAAEDSGYKINLISPWPINPDKGVADQFQKEAFGYLQTHPTGQFFRMDTLNGQAVFRFMTADPAVAQSCVDCHNAHPRSPKRDFRLNDIMGGLEAVFPVVQYQKEDRRDLLATIAGGAAFCLLLMVVSAWGAHRTVTQPLMALAFRLERRLKLREGSQNLDMLEASGNELHRFEEMFDRIQASMALRQQELQTELKKLESDNKQLKQMIEEHAKLSPERQAPGSAVEAFIYLDAAGEIDWVNRKAEEITGWSATELVGRSFLTFLTMESAARARAYIIAKQPGGTVPAPAKYEMVNKAGGSAWFEISVERVNVRKDGEGLLLIARGVTAQVKSTS